LLIYRSRYENAGVWGIYITRQTQYKEHNIYIIIEVLGAIKVCTDNSKMFSGRPFWESIDDVNYFRDTYLET